MIGVVFFIIIIIFLEDTNFASSSSRLLEVNSDIQSEVQRGSSILPSLVLFLCPAYSPKLVNESRA